MKLRYITLPLILKRGPLLNEALERVWSLGTAEKDFVESPPPPKKKDGGPDFLGKSPTRARSELSN